MCLKKVITKADLRQDVPKKILISRELRRRNFGRHDHKRKAWWTILAFKKIEADRIKSKEFWADAICYARLRLAQKRSSASDRDKEDNPSPITKSWLTLIIRVVLILFAVLCVTCNQFGKEYSSCTAGDGPPKKIQRTADAAEIHSIAAGKLNATNTISNL